MPDALTRGESPGRPTTIAGSAEVRLLSHKAAMYVHELCVLPDQKTPDRTGEPRVIALTDEAAEALRSVNRIAERYVFLSRFGKPYTVRGLLSIAKRHQKITTCSPPLTFAQSGIDDGLAPATATKRRGQKSSAMIRDPWLVESVRTLEVRGTA